MGHSLGNVQDFFTLSAARAVDNDIRQQGHFGSLNMEVAETNALDWIWICEMSISLHTTEDFRGVDRADKSTGTITAKRRRNMDHSQSSISDIEGR